MHSIHPLIIICSSFTDIHSEVQNALNDIESLRRERDDLKAQVASYVKSLETACMGKAILDEKLHSLGISGVRV